MATVYINKINLEECGTVDNESQWSKLNETTAKTGQASRQKENKNQGEIYERNKSQQNFEIINAKCEDAGNSNVKNICEKTSNSPVNPLGGQDTCDDVKNDNKSSEEVVQELKDTKYCIKNKNKLSSVKETQQEDMETKKPQLEKMVLIDKNTNESGDIVKTKRFKLHKSTFVKLCLLTALFVLDVADLLADWLLFRDVYTIDEGLVYGPPPESLTYAFLAFSVFGTVTFTFEVINFGKEIFFQKPWMNPDLISAVCVWIEDIPQLVISLQIMVCREEAISYFQLVKAAVIVMGVAVRITLCLILYCNHDTEMKQRTFETCQHVIFRCFIMAGLFVVFSCSLTLFFFTQFEREDDGSIQFNLPKSMFEGKYDDERYFQNVSMYMHHPLINFNESDRNRDDVGWIRLISIYDVREKKEEIFKIDFDEASKTKMVIWQTNPNKTLVIKECYTLDRTAKLVTTESDCTNLIPGPKTSMIFKFVFEEKEIPNLIFGDIKFSCKVEENGVCQTPTITFVTRVSEYSKSTTQQHAIIHYYRTKRDVSQDDHLLKTGPANQTRFYRNELDLIDISNVWKTGFGSCESTGSLAPHISSEVNVECNV